ncbi:hypothetical protein KPATCC21470_0973 [Kitasatospora purpeofusca]
MVRTAGGRGYPGRPAWAAEAAARHGGEVRADGSSPKIREVDPQEILTPAGR